MTAIAAVHAVASLLRLVSGVLIVALPFAWAIDPFGIARANLVLEQLLVAVLGASLAYFYSNRALRHTGIPAALGLIVAAGLFGCCAWLVVLFGSELMIMMPSDAHRVASAALIVAAIAAVTMHAGAPMAIIVLAFLVFGYVAQFLPGGLSSAPVSLGSYLVYMLFGGEGLLGRPVAIISTTVLIFVFFGVVYEVSGGTRAIAALAMAAARHSRGTAIKVAVLASGMFGAISGSVSSNVLTSGAFSIPSMKRIGVPPAMAGGVEAVASTGGQIMPPIMGAAAFLMADLTGIGYGTIALSSLIPAIFCYAVLFQQADRLAHRVERHRPQRAAAETVPDEEAVQLSRIDLLHVLPVLGIVAVMMASEIAIATAGLTGIALALAVSLRINGIGGTLERLKEKMRGSCASAANLVVAASALGIVLAVMNSTGLDIKAGLAIRTIGENSLALSLLVTALAAFVLGMGMTTSGVYIITGTLLAPGLVALGIPVLAAHLFVLYCGVLSMITPPVAIAALSASALAGAGFQRTALAAVRFGWILFFAPVLFVLSPGLVLVGSPAEIAVDVLTAAVFLACLFLRGGTVEDRAARLIGYGAVGLSVLSACSLLPGEELRLAASAASVAVFAGLRAIRFAQPRRSKA